MKYVIDGHSGIGDCLHQRAPLRKLLERGHEVWLRTASVCIYHDLVGPNLYLVNNGTGLRTQAKNIRREEALFTTLPTPADAMFLRPSYNGHSVRNYGSVVNAMCVAFGVDAIDADFRMAVPAAWRAKVPFRAARGYIVYRPPVVRCEWAGAATRNPDPSAYRTIFDAIRGDRMVISVADLDPTVEWIVGQMPEVDVTYHRGELDFEALAALVRGADFVYTTAGMVTVLAQAVETPCITVMGGYERAASFEGGARWSPWCAIEPINPCDCWAHGHDCDKRVNVPAAIDHAQRFLEIVSYETRIPATPDQVAATSGDAGRSRATIDRMERLHEYVGADAAPVGA